MNEIVLDIVKVDIFGEETQILVRTESHCYAIKSLSPKVNLKIGQPFNIEQFDESYGGDSWRIIGLGDFNNAKAK